MQQTDEMDITDAFEGLALGAVAPRKYWKRPVKKQEPNHMNVVQAVHSYDEAYYQEYGAPKAQATQPQATQPQATLPQATQPQATLPQATQPQATQPQATQLSASRKRLHTREPEDDESLLAALGRPRARLEGMFSPARRAKSV